ncbi:hypothetical protein GLAREA_11145 [Glarea lozoyensis ATCC 20868]|uniref:Uncharacterized protein n=1 Tax=Glarea lozoyensis (strain ATCC 20868 / MF5171) TaxID=1116229 RepID=S3DU20_GLAL2|nr:uncharacterized protein GLAREA_11145 [Glarea lozoyensis ATCC 20868]EPE35446.1 hypothetical protein GLAREA_11145 [Glarea lozoyensis ATCC 20868]
MRRSQGLSLALGGLAVSSSGAMLTFDIIFAATLPHTAPLTTSRIAAIVASSLSGFDVAVLLLLIGRQIRYRNGGHIQDFGHGRRHTYIVAGIAGTVAVLSAVASAILFATTKIQIANMSPMSVISSQNLVTGGFIIWAAFLLFQAIFVISIIIVQKRGCEQLTQPFGDEPDREAFPEMEEANNAEKRALENDNAHRGDSSIEFRTPPSSSGRSRAGSDNISSLRSSLSQVVRPISSKTKLIQTSHKSPHRPTSTSSSQRGTSMDDGFDSWDTSTVDAHSRHAVESVSPVGQQRFLETIPASPTGSRSPSPGFPLDLVPPKTRTRSCSNSPANTPATSPKDRERFQKSRTVSPTESMNEAHIHPLFRTVSPTPPPSATPSTIITAAPNAGQLIADRQSIRSIHRMRSGSLPSSPLGHSPSLDSIRCTMEKEELERFEPGGERTLTPPIPDFVLNGGPRNSLAGYNSRKRSLVGINKMGEVRES